jgi:hypothetical protein
VEALAAILKVNIDIFLMLLIINNPC